MTSCHFGLVCKLVPSSTREFGAHADFNAQIDALVDIAFRDGLHVGRKSDPSDTVSGCPDVVALIASTLFWTGYRMVAAAVSAQEGVATFMKQHAEYTRPSIPSQS